MVTKTLMERAFIPITSLNQQKMNCTLEESNTERVPILLEQILTKVLAQTQSADFVQKDILFVLLVILMIENGFVPVTGQIEFIDPVSSIDAERLSKWKVPTGTFEARFVMVGFQDVTLKLIMSPLGSMAIVNIIINELNSETYSVCLPISRYIVSPQASTIPMIFRDLKHFSITCKNRILTAVKSTILCYHGYASASLIGLPEELFCNIIMYLSITDIINVSKTCNRLHSLMAAESLWHDLYKRDFKNNQTITNEWKAKYIQEYLAHKEARLRRARQAGGAMHDYMEYSDYVSYIDNPMWNII